ncbi:MAG: potassium/proton antiporter [Clostridiales bacterium]|jgi:cell volume regulation protein A|nr:potassium/proton antiporter [Clostridiales bacterium]
MSPEVVILFIAGTLVVSAIFTKVCFKIGVPTLIFFLSIGLLVGAEGIVGLRIEDPHVCLIIGTFALSFLIFTGGLNSNLKEARPIIKEAMVLASLGVVITGAITGLAAVYILGFDLKNGLLLGAIVSSTDAAATFSILQSSGIKLKNNIGQLLEFESGSNDPFAYLLTFMAISLMTATAADTSSHFFVTLLQQLIIGGALGILLGFATPLIFDRVNFHQESLYPMFMVAIALLIFAATALIGGNGFLALYVAAVIIGNQQFYSKKRVISFFDGQAWIMQVILFVMLGLMVYPQELPGLALEGVALALIIIFVARPIAVFAILAFFKRPVKDMLFISFAGLRGAASMVFAIFPLIYNIPSGHIIFNIVFFIALISILAQGTLLPYAAKLLSLAEPYNDVVKLTSISRYIDEMEDLLMESSVHPESFAANKTLKELSMPDELRIIRIMRSTSRIMPGGDIVLHPYDTLLLLVHDNEKAKLVRELFGEPEHKD